MGFLAPWFLAGLAAVGLPVWLHLLRKHRTTPLPFASLMFFERRTQSSVKHRRLRYLLLFALRTAFIVLLILAFASPFIRRPGGAVAAGRKLVVLAIDNSFSMRQGDRLGRAKQQAMQAVGSLNPAGRAQVLAFASGVQALSDATNDSASLRSAILSVAATDSRSSYAELVRALRSMAQTARVPVEAHVFSDMQKTSFAANFADMALPEGVRMVPHAVTSGRAPNFTVESVKAPQRVYDQRKLRVQATVAGFGTGPATRRVLLAVNGREVESHTVQVPADGRASVEFTTLEAPFGLNRCEVRTDSGDAFPADDRFFFTLERAEPRPLLFVEERPGSRGLLYYRTALQATGESPFVLEPVAADRTAGMSPGRFAFVVLSDVASLPASFETALAEYVRGGGAVLMAVGRAASLRRRLPVVGDAIAGVVSEGTRSVTWSDTAVPALRDIEHVKFYQTARVDPAGGRVLARLADETPLVIEKRTGQGRVLIFASTFDNISNDFPLHPGFVSFVAQTARQLGHLEDRPAGFAVDSHLELRAAQEKGAAVEVLDPAGSRALSLQEATRAQSVKLAQAGFYDVKRANATHELVAVNADRHESDLDVIPAETLALWSNTGQASREAQGGADGESKPVSLWWYVMLAAMAVAVAESLLGNRHLAAEPDAAEIKQRAVGKEAA